MSNYLKSLEELIQFIEKKWVESTGLVTAIILLFFIEVFAISSLNYNSIVFIIVFPVSSLVLYYFWRKTTLPENVKKGKVGFVISLSCSDDEELLKIREDFIETLRALLNRGKAGSTFQVIEIPQHIAKNIKERDDVEKLRSKTKAHFILYGRVRIRHIDNREKHIVDLNGIVAHKPIPEEVKEQLAAEFAELLPKQFQITKENDIFAFNFSSELTETVAKYIIGIASALSGDLDYAEKLFNDVRTKFNGNEQLLEFPIYKKLHDRIPFRLLEINEARAAKSYEDWLTTSDQRYLDEFGLRINKIGENFKHSLRAIHLKGIYEFLSDRDIEKAIGTILHAKEFTDDITWRYNLGFLYTYQGDLRRAQKEYDRAINSSVMISSRVLNDLEDFLYKTVKEEPDKYQLHFALGYFNWKVKGDLISAVRNFEKFLNENNDYSEYGRLVEAWLTTLKSQAT